MSFVKGTRVTINKDGHNKVVLKEQLDQYLIEGWSKGPSPSNIEHIKESIRKRLSTDKELKEKWGRANTIEAEELRRMKISNTMKGNTNWQFNKGRGNGKKGWYKGINCDSAWELAFIVYHLDHDLKVERCKNYRQYIWNGGVHKYYPDFITDEGVIEVKGIKSKQSREKIKQHPDVIVYDARKMKPILDYVINKYGGNFWEILYE